MAVGLLLNYANSKTPIHTLEICYSAFEPNILPVETLRYRTTSGATHSLKWNIPCALMR